MRPRTSLFPSETWGYRQAFLTGLLRGAGGLPEELAAQTPAGAEGGQCWRVSGWGGGGEQLSVTLC